MIKYYLQFVCLLFVGGLIGQDDSFKYENYVYQEGINTVQTISNQQITSTPIIRLNSSDVFILQFDDLFESEDKRYAYRLIHCDREWLPSDLFDLDFIAGFNNEPLRNWEFSELTLTNFTHYWLQLPNRDTKFRISGNYLLLIYDKNNDDSPVLTRRLMVSEGAATPFSKFVKPNNVSDIRFSHQLAVSTTVGKSGINNPAKEITATILQNGDWESSINNLAPNYVANSIVNFDQFGAVKFPALMEFRSFDLRSLYSRGRGVKKINKNSDGYEVLLDIDNNRSRAVYIFRNDFNGKFYIDNIDRPGQDQIFSLLTSDVVDDSIRQNFIFRNELIDGIYDAADKDLRSDYAMVEFNLKSRKLQGDVYVFGALSSWRTDDRFKMDYDDYDGMYKKKLLLKQGYYDYMYSYIDPVKKERDFKRTEGSWTDTENEYLILLYARQFGSRYDRLLGYRIAGTNDYTDVQIGR